MTRRRSVPGPLAAVLALAVLEASAGGGVKPIHQPTNIVQGGSYCLTRNVTGGGAPVITIDVDPNDDVALNLNGFTVTQTDPLFPAIQVDDGRNVTIENGTVRGGLDNITFFTPPYLNSRTMIAVAADDGLDDGVRVFRPNPLGSFVITNSIVVGSGRHGVNIEDTAQVFVDDVWISGVGGDGLLVQGPAVQAGVGVQNVSIARTGGSGMRLSQVGPSALNGVNIVATENGLVLTQAEGVRIDALSVQSPRRDGLVLQGSRGVSGINIVIDSPGRHGILADPNSLTISLGDILVERAGVDGVLWLGRSSALRNLMALGSGACGLRFGPPSSGNHWAGSFLRGSILCSGAGTGTTDFRDQGVGNTSQGDNQAPGPM